jgi:hypothetical protein
VNPLSISGYTNMKTLTYILALEAGLTLGIWIAKLTP